MKKIFVGLMFVLWVPCTLFGEEVPAQSELKAGVPDNPAIQWFSDGSRYVGQFKDGAIHGRGEITFFDGSNYTGEFADGEINGQGTMVFPDGSRYVGQFRDGRLHGQGMITFSDGSTYEGQFAKNQYHGEGVWSSPDGITYAGQFKAGRFDGHGIYTLPNGSRFVGRFRDDHIQDGSWDDEQSPDSAFAVQVGAFMSRTNAETLSAMLRKKGYSAFVQPLTDYAERSWYAVRLRRHVSLEEARKEATVFSETEKLTATVRPADTL